MADGKILLFRERSKALHDEIFIFPTEQLFNTEPAFAVLERYGVNDPQALVRPCIRGTLEEQIGTEHTGFEDGMTQYAMLCVPAVHVTNELKRAFKANLRELHVYELSYLIAKAVYPIQLEGMIGGHHIRFRSTGHEARSIYERWIADGAVRTLAHHLQVSPTLSETVFVRHPSRPVYAQYGLQTFDDEFLIEKSKLEGPLRCAYHNETIIVNYATTDG